MPKSRLTTNIVEPQGDYDARMCFIGEAPGEEEDYDGIPFVGSAGQLLKRCFSMKNIFTADIILDNVFMQRPPDNRVNYYYRDKSNRFPTWEGEEHIEMLRKRLLSLQENSSVNVLVALGSIACQTLTGHSKITKWRGSILPCTLVEGFKVYPMNHPSAVNRAQQEQQEKKLVGEKKKQAMNLLPAFLLDLERVIEQSYERGFVRPEREFKINMSLDEIIHILDMLTKGSIDCSVDIETLPDKTGPIVWMIGFSPTPEVAYTIYFLRNGQFAWPEKQETEILRAISRYFLCSGKKIFQNGGYDLAVLGRYYGLRVAPGTYEDTMWAHQSNYPYMRKGLAFLASIYTWEPYYKDDGKVHFGKRSSDNAEGVYNGRDCCVTKEILPVILRDGRELQTIQNYERTRTVFPSHLAMTLRGIRVDIKAKENLSRDFVHKAQFHQAEVNRKCGGLYNLNSADQKSRLLYGYLALKFHYDRKTNKVTTDKEALQKLHKEYPPTDFRGEIVEHIIRYQHFAKLASTYTSMEVDTDGRIRTSYGWVSTWRTSSSGSPYIFDVEKKKQAGANLQNIPVRSEEGRMVRKLFLADEGKILLASDLRQAEAMVVAWEAEDLRKIELFLDGSVDVHWDYACEIFNIPKDTIYLGEKGTFTDPYTKQSHTHKEYRDLGKTTRHATNYDEGPAKFQASLITFGFHLPFNTCKSILEGAKSKDLMLSEWKRKIREKLKADRYLISSIGDKRLCQARLNDDTFRAFYAFSPQNTVGRVLQEALQEAHEKFSYMEILLNIHDEIIVQIFPEDLERAMVDLRSVMERPLIIHGRELTIPCDFKSGPNWGELTEIKE